MNRLVLLENEVCDSRATVKHDWRTKHMLEVLRVDSRDSVRALLLNQGLCDFEIESVDAKGIHGRIGRIESGFRPWFHLLIGLCRPPSMRKILEHATTAGMASIHFVQSHLSEKSFAGSRFFRREEYQPLLLRGLAQSAVYTTLPRLQFSHNLAKALHCIPPDSNRLLMDLQSSRKIQSADLHAQDVVLAIGPERGWTDSEIQLLQQYRFSSTWLSNTTLRVETATMHAVAQMEWIRHPEENDG